MRMMYVCRKCHNIVFAEEDYTRKICFRCEEEHFEAAMISEQEADKMSEEGTFGEFLDELWGLSAKRVLLMVQNNPDECICYNEKTKEITLESGRNLKKPKSDILNWKTILSDSLKLGKCGELYAQNLLESMGYTVYYPLVDNHGVDLVAKKSNGRKLLVQVKTVKEGNYSFISKDNFYKDEDFAVFYIRVDKDGVPSVFVYPSKVWPEESESEITYTYDGRFTYHPYSGEDQKSKAEYGISGAKKYYSSSDEFCIDTDNFWICNKEKFDKIVGAHELGEKDGK